MGGGGGGGERGTILAVRRRLNEAMLTKSDVSWGNSF